MTAQEHLPDLLCQALATDLNWKACQVFALNLASSSSIRRATPNHYCAGEVVKQRPTSVGRMLLRIKRRQSSSAENVGVPKLCLEVCSLFVTITTRAQATQASPSPRSQKPISFAPSILLVLVVFAGFSTSSHPADSHHNDQAVDAH